MNKTQLAVVCLTLSATSIFAQQPAFKRTVLQQADLSIPGREVVMARVDFPMGASAGRHTHPGEEIGYVLDGTVSVEIEGVAKSLKAGDTFLIPTGKVHNATNLGSTTATVISSYVVEKGKPLATPVK